MPVSEIEMHRTGHTMPISAELLDESNETRAAFVNWLKAKPEARARAAEEARVRRAEERATAERRPLALDALLEKLGFSREYAEHLMQPYCHCDHGWDGWDVCPHAYDEGLRE
jgi:hypothetical protein